MAAGFVQNIFRLTKKYNRLYTPFGQLEILNFDVPKPIVFIPHLFLGDVSKSVSKELNSLICRFYPQIRLWLIYNVSVAKYSTIYL